MNGKKLNKTFTLIIALVWLINGLICKVLNLVPRHQEIVGRILGHGHSRTITIFIGIAEILMGIWVLSKIKSRMNSIIQIIIIACMNILEFTLAPDLLLWHRWNIIFAFLFIILIYYNEFKINQNPTSPSK